jgi:hypothetical protein
MGRRPLVQKIDQARVHEVVVIRNIQADHLGVAEMRGKSALEPAAVSLLHYEHQVGPVEQV